MNVPFFHSFFKQIAQFLYRQLFIQIAIYIDQIQIRYKYFDFNFGKYALETHFFWLLCSDNTLVLGIVTYMSQKKLKNTSQKQNISNQKQNISNVHFPKTRVKFDPDFWEKTLRKTLILGENRRKHTSFGFDRKTLILVETHWFWESCFRKTLVLAIPLNFASSQKSTKNKNFLPRFLIQPH